MEKLLSIIVVCLVISTNIAHSASLEDRINKIEHKYEQSLSRIEKSRYTKERKALLKQHAKQNKDLKIAQIKDLEALKKKLPPKNTKK